MAPVTLISVVVAATMLLATGCGSDGSSDSTGRGDGARVVDVEMVDIGFKPTQLTVREGETVTFRFKNTGKLAHDAFIGDRDAQAEHEETMAEESGGHGAHGDDGTAITVEPGDTETLTYTFDEGGDLEIGCHQPGHYSAGMKINVAVE